MDLKACRICCESEGTLDIFDDSSGLSLSALMMYCSARLSVTRGDALPASVCEPCEAALRAAYRLVRRAEQADRRLRAACRLGPGDAKPEDDGDREDDPAPEPPSAEAEDEAPRVRPARRVRCDPAALTCTECGLRSASRAAHAAHARSHAGLAPHACAHCDKRYRDAGSLRRHAARHHGPPGARRRNFTCEACGKGFYSRGDVVVHLRTHTGETPYRCAAAGCGARFTQASALLRHARRHAGDKPHACPAPACGKRFCTREEARHHERAHSDERPYACPVCAASFKYRNNLRKHALLHSAAGRGRFVCAECGRAFSQAGNLRGHAARRHGAGAGAGRQVVELRCPAAAAGCARTFGSSRALARHLSHAHAPRVFVGCGAAGCARQFATRAALRHHELRAHSAAVPFPCARCDRPFYRRNDLARHMIATHEERLAR